MSSLTSPLYAAAQYALLSSLYALPGKLLGGLSGFAVSAFGYPAFFVATSCIGIPVAADLPRRLASASATRNATLAPNRVATGMKAD